MRVGSPLRGIVIAGVICVLAGGHAERTLEAQRAASGPAVNSTPPSALIDEYCLSCHDQDHKKADLALDALEADAIDRHPDVWEKVVRKLRARQMPPVGKERPDEATYDAAVASLESVARPRRGRAVRIPAGRRRSAG